MEGRELCGVEMQIESFQVCGLNMHDCVLSFGVKFNKKVSFLTIKNF